jgi:hypothetical protein
MPRGHAGLLFVRGLLMHRVTRTLLAALMVAVPLASTVNAGVAAPVAYAAPAAVAAAAVTDADDLIPYVEEVRAALLLLDAPTINEMDVLDGSPLADSFDESARYVAVPSGTTGQLTMIVGSWLVEDGTDEHQDFTDALDELKAYGQSTGGAVESSPVTTADAFGANEAVEVAIVSVSGGKPTSLLVGRLARFGRAIAFTSADVEIRGDAVSPDDTGAAAMVSVVLAKLVADKAK